MTEATPLVAGLPAHVKPPTRPILRYHGGKWKLAPWIISNFPPHRIYVEPFGGAASVLLRKDRSHAEIYNDMDGELVNLFRVARDYGADLVRAIELTPFARDEFAESYTPAADPIEQARRTMLRCAAGFGSNSFSIRSGFRCDAKRSGTTPAGDWRKMPEVLKAIVKRLSGVVVENRDASQVMLSHDTGETLHYVDPPYVHSTRMNLDANLRRGYRHEMRDADHEDLAETLHMLYGKVCLSGYPSPLYEKLYADWRRVECASLADGAKKRTEVLWMNYPASDDMGYIAP